MSVAALVLGLFVASMGAAFAFGWGKPIARVPGWTNLQNGLVMMAVGAFFIVKAIWSF